MCILGLFGCSFDTKKEDYLIPGIPFRYRYVYATGFELNMKQFVFSYQWLATWIITCKIVVNRVVELTTILIVNWIKHLPSWTRLTRCWRFRKKNVCLNVITVCLFYLIFCCCYVCVVPAAYSSSAERNYYRILGVAENASQDEIKKAFHSVSDCWKSLYL